jgi:hypothetical protein
MVEKNEPLDLSIALKTMHELGLANGDLGYAYWYAVAQLLKNAQQMAVRVRELEGQVERLSARCDKGRRKQLRANAK